MMTLAGLCPCVSRLYCKYIAASESDRVVRLTFNLQLKTTWSTTKHNPARLEIVKTDPVPRIGSLHPAQGSPGTLDSGDSGGGRWSSGSSRACPGRRRVHLRQPAMAPEHTHSRFRGRVPSQGVSRGTFHVTRCGGGPGETVCIPSFRSVWLSVCLVYVCHVLPSIKRAVGRPIVVRFGLGLVWCC